jgi:cell division protein FtsZ
MTLNLRMPDLADLKPKITVFGVGGAGGNAVNNMIDKNLEGADFVVANTDAQALQQSKSDNKLQLGEKYTEGLGAGARPAVGAAAAEESIEAIVDHLAGSHMCFITAGMGGGTGTGAAPIIAQAARELGVLTVGVVTKPFQFEGSKRMRQAEDGVEALQKVVDTLIIIPNQNLFRIANEKTTFTEAFSMADDVLYQGVKGVTDLMVKPGIINLDFADIRSVMDEMGKAMMGTGEGEGEDRAIQAAEKAIANPLLDEISLRGAKGVLINITGGHDLTLFELDEAANRIREEVDPDANIIVGSTLDTGMEGMMRVSVVATGIDAVESRAEMPLPRRSMKAPLALKLEDVKPAEPATPEVVAEVSPLVAEVTADLSGAKSAKTPPEPSLFEEFQYPVEDLHDEVGAHTDDVPEPVYQPQQNQASLEADASDPAPEEFIAPRSTPIGQPSPETLARLQAAVTKQTGQAKQAAAPAFFQGQEEEKSHRFGLNNLISRMTGHADRVTPSQTERHQPTVSTAPPPATPEDADPEQERTDIPAFLRRQAN